MMTGPFVLPIPYRDPLIAFAPLATEPMAVLLDSALATAQGRHSYIAAMPRAVIRATYTDRPDAFARVAAALGPIRHAKLPVPFGGGAIGWFGYELGGAL